MEVATDEDYVADALYEKGKKNNPALKPHESLNATHDALKLVGGDAETLAGNENVHPKLSHFYGRHGAQISKAESALRDRRWRRARQEADPRARDDHPGHRWLWSGHGGHPELSPGRRR